MKINKNKRLQFLAGATVVFIIALGWLSLMEIIETTTLKTKQTTVNKMTDYLGLQGANASVSVKRKKINEQPYKYNDQIDERVILAEVHDLATRFNLIEKNWIILLRCEATCTEYNFKRHNCTKGELDNKAENKNSTAVGLGQYLINTWYGTESWKQFSKARTDYKAALWEMALDLNSGQQSKWQECMDLKGVYKFKN